jgi:putative flippase GtrA
LLGTGGGLKQRNMATSALKKLLQEACGYGLVSAVALGVDMSVLNALVKWAGWHYLVASAVAFAAGATVAYLLSIRFVFPLRKLHNPSLQFVWFVALGLAGLMVNAAALFVAISAVGLGLNAAKILAAGCTFLTNFTLRRQLLFSSPKAP